MNIGAAKKEDTNAKDRVRVLTSNVDGYFRRVGFDNSQVCEIHGSLRNWQCGGLPSGKLFPQFVRDRCCESFFAPPNIQVDPESLQLLSDEGVSVQLSQGDSHEPTKQKILCPSCHEGLIRPNVYLFGDGKHFVEDEDVVKSRDMFDWKHNVASLAGNPSSQRSESGVESKGLLVIVEIGCGLRIPSVRKRCEELAASVGRDHCQFIRINPEYPQNEILYAPDIAIKDNGLHALCQIDQELQKLTS